MSKTDSTIFLSPTSSSEAITPTSQHIPSYFKNRVASPSKSAFINLEQPEMRPTPTEMKASRSTPKLDLIDCTPDTANVTSSKSAENLSLSDGFTSKPDSTDISKPNLNKNNLSSLEFQQRKERIEKMSKQSISLPSIKPKIFQIKGHGSVSDLAKKFATIAATTSEKETSHRIAVLSKAERSKSPVQCQPDGNNNENNLTSKGSEDELTKKDVVDDSRILLDDFPNNNQSEFDSEKKQTAETKAEGFELAKEVFTNQKVVSEIKEKRNIPQSIFIPPSPVSRPTSKYSTLGIKNFGESENLSNLSGSFNSEHSWLNPTSLDPPLSAILESFDLEEISETEESHIASRLSMFSNLIGSSNGSSPRVSVAYPSETSSVSLTNVDSNKSESIVEPEEVNYLLTNGNRLSTSISSTFQLIMANTEMEELEKTKKLPPHIKVSKHSRTASLIRETSPGSDPPLPPPKSALRSKSASNSPSVGKIIRSATTGAEGSSRSRHPPQTNYRTKPLGRKFSDPGFVTQSAFNDNLSSSSNSVNSLEFDKRQGRHKSTLPSRNKRSYYSDFGPPLATPDSQIPTRMASLDHLSNHTNGLRGVANKPKKIIDELVDTESTYLADLKLLKSIYYDGAVSRPELLTPRDIKLLFNNLDEIVSFTSEFLQTLLEHSSYGVNPSIGQAFIEKYDRLHEVYSFYFKMYEESTTHLKMLTDTQPAFVVFLEECGHTLAKQSNAWDLASLLIKPIQRVLKYPLLLKELIRETSTDHPDHANLALAHDQIQAAANDYNDSKRRKDLLNRMLGPKHKKSDHQLRTNLNKKLLRGAHQLRLIGSHKPTIADDVYDELVHQYNQLESQLRKFWEEVQSWNSAVETFFKCRLSLSETFANVYSEPSSVSSANLHPPSYQLLIGEYCKVNITLIKQILILLDNEINTLLRNKVNVMTRLFDRPTLLMKKRDRKLGDLGQNQTGKDGSEDTSESAEVFQLLHHELVEDLPKFIDLIKSMFTLLVAQFVKVQAKVMEHPAIEMDRLIKLYLRRTASETGELEPEPPIVERFDQLVEPFWQLPTLSVFINNGEPDLSDLLKNSMLSRSTSIDSSTKVHHQPTHQRRNLSNVTYLDSVHIDSSLDAAFSSSFKDHNGQNNTNDADQGVHNERYEELLTAWSSSVQPPQSNKSKLSNLDIGGDGIIVPNSMHSDPLEKCDSSVHHVRPNTVAYHSSSSDKLDLPPGQHIELHLTKSLENLPVHPPHPELSTSTPSFDRPTSGESSVRSTPSRLGLKNMDFGNDSSFSDQHSYRTNSTYLLHSPTESLPSPTAYYSLLSSWESEPNHRDVSKVKSLLKASRNPSPLALPHRESSTQSTPGLPTQSNLSDTRHSEGGMNSNLPTRYSELDLSATYSNSKPDVQEQTTDQETEVCAKEKRRPILFTCVSRFPYLAATSAELSLHPNDQLEVYKVSDKNGIDDPTKPSWWYGKVISREHFPQDRSQESDRGARGWFPSNFCHMLD